MCVYFRYKMIKPSHPHFSMAKKTDSSDLHRGTSGSPTAAWSTSATAAWAAWQPRHVEATCWMI